MKLLITKLQRCNHWSLGRAYYYLPMLGLKFIHVSERGTRKHSLLCASGNLSGDGFYAGAKYTIILLRVSTIMGYMRYGSINHKHIDIGVVLWDAIRGIWCYFLCLVLSIQIAKEHVKSFIPLMLLACALVVSIHVTILFCSQLYKDPLTRYNALCVMVKDMALSYYSDLTLPQAFQPMAAQH